MGISNQKGVFKPTGRMKCHCVIGPPSMLNGQQVLLFRRECWVIIQIIPVLNRSFDAYFPLCTRFSLIWEMFMNISIIIIITDTGDTISQFSLSNTIPTLLLSLAPDTVVVTLLS